MTQCAEVRTMNFNNIGSNIHINGDIYELHDFSNMSGTEVYWIEGIPRLSNLTDLESIVNTMILKKGMKYYLAQGYYLSSLAQYDLSEISQSEFILKAGEEMPW